jgi:hypothetical protein
MTVPRLTAPLRPAFAAITSFHAADLSAAGIH